MAKNNQLVSLIDRKLDVSGFREQHWEGTFWDYLDIVTDIPSVSRNAFQRVYDMILSYGVESYTQFKQEVTRYKFFADPIDHGADAIFGLEKPLMQLVDFFKSAAQGYGTEKRILLLHGPVGSSKSTIARLLKKGLEHYSKTDAGKCYTYMWRVHHRGAGGDEGEQYVECPMHEEPMLLIPREARRDVLENVNDKLTEGHKIRLYGDVCPFCRKIYADLLEQYDGDWKKAIDHIKVKRLILSEKDRRGVGTFQPKDEKNQDSTELTGDINYRKIAEYGSDSDPRAFNFDGEFNIANRGIVEFVEVLKLDVAFLYDLLGASQEHKIKPKKFAQTDIDEVIIGHTNEAEYKKLLNNEFMEALRDRTIKIDIPYIPKVNEEIRIYQKDFNGHKVRGKHIAPHTLEVAAMWAVLTRLEDPKKHNLSILQKMKLYDGKVLPGYTQDTVKELRKEAKREGMEGISPRYVQDKISNALVNDVGEGTINPFMVMNELEKGLRHHSLITSDEQKKRYAEVIGIVKREYEEIVKNEVQRAISADEEAIHKLAGNYIDNIKAYTLKEKVKNRYTGQDVEPDERLMRSIEEKIDIPENRKDDFRREIMNYIGALAVDGKRFEWHTNDRLRRALELKLFEDQKDSIKLKTLVSAVVDKDTQEKIDIIKSRLIKYFGYNEVSATDVLNYVASIFARGDAKD